MRADTEQVAARAVTLGSVKAGRNAGMHVLGSLQWRDSPVPGGDTVPGRGERRGPRSIGATLDGGGDLRGRETARVAVMAVDRDLRDVAAGGSGLLQVGWDPDELI
ncbi:MAG: hypothetical protein EA388_14970, partial [Nitriliruptor sp.]